MATLNISVVDGNQQAQMFTEMSETVAYLMRYPQAIFTIYAPRETYDAVCKQVFDQENHEDYQSIWNYRMMKGSVSSWGDIDDLNDMIDVVYARIHERERRLSYGGEKRVLHGTADMVR